MIEPDFKVVVDQLQLAKFLRELKSSMNSVKVGYNENSGKYNNGKNVVEVAQINEYGFGHHPPRPFMSRTVEDNHFRYEDFLNEELSKIDTNNLKQGIDKTLLSLGNKVKEDMQYTIDLMGIDDPRTSKDDIPEIDGKKMKDGIQVELENK